MIFVIDANIVISALISSGKSREILIDSPFLLYSPETLLESIKKYEELIIEKSCLSKNEFDKLLELILGSIIIVEKDKYQSYIAEADALIGNIDVGDVPYLALALSMRCDGIWSQDVHFERQNKVKVWKSEEIIRQFNNLN